MVDSLILLQALLELICHRPTALLLENPLLFALCIPIACILRFVNACAHDLLFRADGTAASCLNAPWGNKPEQEADCE